MTCNDVLEILENSFSYEDFQNTCDYLLESRNYPDISKLSRIERIEFYRKKKEIQLRIAKENGITFNPLYSLEHLRYLERIAKLEGTGNSTNTINIDTVERHSIRKQKFLERINQLSN